MGPWPGQAGPCPWAGDEPGTASVGQGLGRPGPSPGYDLLVHSAYVCRLSSLGPAAWALGLVKPGLLYSPSN